MNKHIMYSGNPTTANVVNPEHIYIGDQQVEKVYVNNKLKALFHQHIGNSTSGGGCYGVYHPAYQGTPVRCGKSLHGAGDSGTICDYCGANLDQRDHEGGCNVNYGSTPITHKTVYCACSDGHYHSYNSNDTAPTSCDTVVGYTGGYDAYYSRNCGRETDGILYWDEVTNDDL